MLLCICVCLALPAAAQINYTYGWEPAGLGGWTTTGGGGGARSTTSPCVGSASLRNSIGFGGGTWTVTSPLTGTSNGQPASYSFTFRREANNNWGSLTSRWGTSPTGPWNPTTQTVSDQNCNTFTVNFTPASGANIYLQFEVVRNFTTSFTDRFYSFDNVSVTQAALVCPAMTVTPLPDCGNSAYSLQFNVSAIGSGGSLAYSVNGVAQTPVAVPSAGTYTVGPVSAAFGTSYTLSNSLSGTFCGSVSGSYNSNCPVQVVCGTTIALSACYGNNETRSITYTSSDLLSNVSISFIAGSIGPNDVVTFYDGTDNSGTILGGNGYTNTSLNGLVVTSIGPSMFVEIISDGSGSCQTGQQTSWLYEVECAATCQDPDGVANVITDCSTSSFSIDVEIVFVGGPDVTATTLRYTVNGGAPVLIPGLVDFQVQNIGPFAMTDVVNVRLLHEDDAACDKNLGNFTRNQFCPPANDLCANATALTVKTPAQCPAQATGGTTFDANLEIAAPSCGGAGTFRDVWYTFNSGWNTSPIAVSIAAGTMTHWGVELWTACGGTMLSCASNSPTSVNFTGYTAYTDYRIRVFTNTALGATGSFNICLSATPLPTSCGEVIRDPGGTGNYGNNQNVTTTYCPTTPGEVLTMTFSQFATQSGSDFVRVYNGPSTASPLLGTFSGSSIPGPFISTHASGCLTVNFTSNGFSTDAGYTATLACCVAPVPSAAASNNGPLCVGSDVQLNSTTNIGTTFNWTGPNGFSSALQNPAITGATTAANGIYTVTIRNGANGCPATANTTVSISALPTPVNAGADQTACASPGTATMAATAPTSGSGIWTKEAGGSATINTAGSPTTTISGLNVAGSPYTFRWTVSNSPCASAFDEMVITVNPAPSNSNAGPDQTICITQTATLAANTPTVGTGTWSVLSGSPSTSSAQFSSTSSPTAVFTPSGGSGTYTLRWTISTPGCSSSTNNVEIDVNGLPSASNAGPDQSICVNANATLAANNPSTGSGSWSVVAGSPSTLLTQFSNPSSRQSTFTPAGGTGTYTLRWTISNAPCASTSDDVVITVGNLPSTSNAGPDQTICTNTTATLGANTPVIGTGVWSVVAGSPSTSNSQFSSTTSPTAIFTPAGGAGGYTLRWTISNNPCSASTNDVVINVNAAPTGVAANSSAATVCAGNSVDLSATGSGTGTLLAQTFNAGAGGWTTTNTSTGGTTANAAWTLRANNYFYNASSGADPTFSSNDASQFYLSNSDAQGSGTTATTLVSPSFSTVGYSTVSLSYYHYYRYNSGTSDRAFVEVSTNGSSWTTLQTHSSTQGAEDDFVLATVNLNSVAGQPTVFVRFRYAATWDWYWAVDNVVVNATGSSALSWAWTADPVGFTSNAQNPTNVTVAQSTTYTVQANAQNGCSATSTVTVNTVAPANAGTNGTNTLCSNEPTFSLIDFLGGNPQGGGAWTGPSTVVGGMYDPNSMDQGVYTYTVTGTSPCPNVAATVTVTETPATLWYADQDGDNVGDPNTSQAACVQPGGYVASNTDLCPLDGLKLTPGGCGCGVVDVPETYYADTDGDGFGAGAPMAGFTCIVLGVTNNTDLCATDPLKQAPGVCGCGVADVPETYYADTDGDGFGAGAAIPGFTCDVPAGHVTNNTDLCATDPNKTTPGQCGCGNVDTDTDGDLTADCNDLCPNDPNKITPGQCGCGNPDVDSDNDGIANCNDACPNDANNDQDGDGICGDIDSCPTVFGEIGNICDANPAPGFFTLGELNSSCVCAAAACTQNLRIEFQADANPIQNTWELREQGTNTLVRSGIVIAAVGMPLNVGTANTCVPDGCYYLKVLDSGGDGMTVGANGGYVLRSGAVLPGSLAENQRIIDNHRNFSGGSVSQIAANEGFCVPFGTTTSGIYTTCDKLDWLPTGEYYACSSVPAVSAQWSAGNTPAEAISGYEFWFFNPNGGYSFRKFRSHHVSDGFSPDNATRACHIKINNWAAPNLIPNNVLMNVRVRTRVNGTYGQWGTACRFMIDPVRAACPLTNLMDIPGDANLSCGSTRVWGAGNYIHARPVAGATQYQWRFRIDAESYITIRTTTTYFIQLNWTTLPLQNGKTYQVEVRAFKNGAWCIDTPTPAFCGFAAPCFTPWGTMCSLTIDNTPAVGGNQNMVSDGTTGTEPVLRMYPNPNRGDQLYVQLDALEEGVSTVTVDILDLTGKRVSARTIPVQGDLLNTVIDLNGELTSGIYLVNITAGSEHFTQRLVIQH